MSRTISLVLLAACSKSADAPAPASEPKPLVARWSTETFQDRFTVEGGGAGTVYPTPEGITIILEKLEGSTYAIGARTGTVTNGYTVLAAIDHLAALGPVAFKDIDRVDTKLVLGLTLADGRSGEVKLPALSYTNVLADIFMSKAPGPLRFGAEPADPNPGDSIAYPHGGLTGRILGHEGTLQEIDFVATQKALATTEKKTCDGYTGSITAFTIRLEPIEVTLWNRRTGEVVETKTVTPSAECPITPYAMTDKEEVASRPPIVDIQNWLKTKLKR